MLSDNSNNNDAKIVISCELAKKNPLFLRNFASTGISFAKYISYRLRNKHPKNRLKMRYLQ